MRGTCLPRSSSHQLRPKSAQGYCFKYFIKRRLALSHEMAPEAPSSETKYKYNLKYKYQAGLFPLFLLDAAGGKTLER